MATPSPALRILASGSYATAAASSRGGGERIEVATSAKAFETLWREEIGSEALPPVDFAREDVVFLLMGRRSTGGYAIEPGAVREESGAVVIESNIVAPAGGTITTMAFSAPFSVVAIPKLKQRAVEWRSGSRTIARREMEAAQ